MRAARKSSSVPAKRPFKTAISSQFSRSWPYVFYAVSLLGVGLTIERFYCRFVCPLGGALAILGRFHILRFLKRRTECGSPCHLCEVSCPVGAIAPDGAVRHEECFYCLDCQVEYFDEHRCPPLTQQRRARVPGMPPGLGALASGRQG